jgi:hypothetical protein
MNSLSDAARAIAEGAQALEPDVELGIPLDETRSVRVLRSSMRPELVVSVTDLPVGRSPEEQHAQREALLRLSADSRWTDGFVGGLDGGGVERISVALTEPLEASRVESLLSSLLARLARSGSSGDPAQPAPDGVPAAWLRA